VTGAAWIQILVDFRSILRVLLGNVWFFFEVLDKDRELGEAHAEIKALRLSERAREKAVEEVTSERSSCLPLFEWSFHCIMDWSGVVAPDFKCKTW